MIALIKSDFKALYFPLALTQKVVLYFLEMHSQPSPHG